MAVNGSSSTTPTVDSGDGQSQQPFLVSMTVVLSLCSLCFLLLVAYLVKKYWVWLHQQPEPMVIQLPEIPIVTYTGNLETDTCPVCLKDFLDGDQLRVLNGCSHRFHVDCIDGWLASHPSCPTCRLSVLAGS